MSDIADQQIAQAPPHPSAMLYVIVAVFLTVLTIMELTVAYVHALHPVLVPVLLILAAAKFALVAMFYMHLKYDAWTLTGVFGFALLVATVLTVCMLLLFGYLLRHPGAGALFG